MKSNSMCFDIATRDRVAFIQSCWHRDIVDRLRDSFLDEFAKLDGRQVDVFEVPGAFEIPLKAQFLANSGKYAAVVAAGLVVDGGIYRHEFVASAVIDGLMKTQLASHTPIFSAVLTPHDFISDGQPEFFAEHFTGKGIESAQACALTLAEYSREQIALVG
ncbi:6,7-dimethyl-8-ribityllumazine synthase [Dasania marina]|uniref:6,7-dimethyl-8-ribityllumazine synthase n=1 Tax=Dasania marina TaxID=471499 RepID=UPI0030D7CD20